MSLIAAFVSSMRGKKYVHEGAKSIFNENDPTNITSHSTENKAEAKEMVDYGSGK